LNDESKDFVDKKPRLSHERKSNKDFVEIDSRHGSRVRLIDRLRSTVRFTQDPKPLTYKRPSQLKIRLADYVGHSTTTENLGGHSGKSNTF